MAYEWYIRRRPDLLHLQPLLPITSLVRDAAHVPHGVMTRAPSDQLNNDHLLVCPGGELCERSFTVYDRTYARCDAQFRMRWPWQSLITRQYPKGSLRLFNHAYTIVRAQASRSQRAGPECVRLACGASPYSTGCVATNLVAFVPRCEAAAREWQAWESESPAVVLRRLAAADEVGDGMPSGVARASVTGEAIAASASARHGVHEQRKYAALLASIAPIPCRDDFALLANTRFYQTGHAGEIGVFLGTFAAANLKLWDHEYAAIDAWAWRPDDDPADKNFKRERDNLGHMEQARQAVAFAGSRVQMIRAKSLEAVSRFPDGHFDWLFIDALHTEQALLDDMHAWWPKLRPGGLFTGDDYGDENATAFASAQRYAKMYGRWGGDRNVPAKHHWGVMRATQRFAEEVGVPLHVTWMRDCYNWPAWYMVKPSWA